MKLLIFSIAVAIYGIQVFGASFREMAVHLTAKINAIKENMDLIQSMVNEHISQLSSTDLDIRKEKRIDGVQTALNQKAGKPGFDACRKRFEDAVAATLVIAKAIVQQRLNNVLLSLTNFNTVLDPIKSSLTGPALDNEIKNCDKDPKKCKLTGEYLTSVSDAANAITDIMKDMSKSLTLIMDKRLSDQIDNNLVKPVTDCLTPL